MESTSSSVSAKVFLKVEESPSDPTRKTSILVVDWIQLIGDEYRYYFPPEARPIGVHTVLKANTTIANHVKKLTKRGQSRTVKLKFDEALQEEYTDDGGNVEFQGYYLREVREDELQKPVQAPILPPTENPANPTEPKKKSLQSITKDMICTKFTAKNQNAQSWLQGFCAECDRLTISRDQRKEALRLFLEKSPADWYMARWRSAMHDSWEQWEASFIESFSEQGWSEISYAIYYKWMSPSTYSEYVIKKNALIIEALPEIPECSRMALVAVGLPNYVKERLKKKNVLTQENMLTEVSQYETSARRNGSNKSDSRENASEKRKGERNGKQRNPDYKPCTFCEKKGFKDRYHHPMACWNNPASSEYKGPRSNNNKNSQNGDRNIKMVNNSELEELFNDEIKSKN